jgi:hypothetical protein
MVADEEQLAGPEQDVGESSEKPAQTTSDEEAGRGGASRCYRLRRPTGSIAPRGVRPVLRPVESVTTGDGGVGNIVEEVRLHVGGRRRGTTAANPLTLTSRRTMGNEVGAGPGLSVSHAPFALYGVASFPLIW